MLSAEIIAIGTELLLGEIVDTNTQFLLKELNELGIDVFRTVIVGDNLQRISGQILQSLNNASIVITTGGLGPTVDDPTREAVANAFDDQLVFSDYLWVQIEERFKRFHHQPTDNNRRQAFIPQKAIAIENAVGTAPAFYIAKNNKLVISLPGVPAEVKYIFRNECVQLIKQLFAINYTTFSRIIRTAGIGESSLDSLIGKFEKTSNPTVGLTAKPGQVNIRITAKAKNKQIAQKMIKPVEEEIVQILGHRVYGYDEDTLPEIVRKQLSSEGKIIHLFHAPISKSLSERLSRLNCFASIKEIEEADNFLQNNMASLYNKSNQNIFNVLLEVSKSPEKTFSVSVFHAGSATTNDFHFGGHSDLFNPWVENYLLNTIRKEILTR